MRAAGECVGHRPVEPGERGSIRRQIDLTVPHPFAQQRECRKQAARARVAGQLAEKGLGVDGSFEHLLELFGIEQQQALPGQKGRRVGPADGAEMRMVHRERRRQAGGRRLCLFRFLGVDDRDQQIGKLRELRIEGQGPLPPGQALGKHLVGIGADAQVVGRIEAGEPRQAEPGHDNEHPVAPAEIDQAGQQALKYHRKAGSYSVAAAGAR